MPKSAVHWVGIAHAPTFSLLKSEPAKIPAGAKIQCGERSMAGRPVRMSFPIEDWRGVVASSGEARRTKDKHRAAASSSGIKSFESCTRAPRTLVSESVVNPSRNHSIFYNPKPSWARLFACA